MFYFDCLLTVCLLFRRMSHPYPRQCPAPTCFYLAVSELAFRRHLVLHHHVELEFQEGREEFRRMSSPEGERRARAIRGRRRGRQCQRQIEAEPPPSDRAVARGPLSGTTDALPSGGVFGVFLVLIGRGGLRYFFAGGHGPAPGVILRRPSLHPATATSRSFQPGAAYVGGLATAA